MANAASCGLVLVRAIKTDITVTPPERFYGVAGEIIFENLTMIALQCKVVEVQKPIGVVKAHIGSNYG